MSSWKEYREKGELPEAARLTLLLVDDEERILESLSELLQDRFHILTARSGGAALELFREHRPEIVLCDQRMPGKTGIEILSEVKEIEPGTRRMLITGFSDIDVVIRALNEQILHRYITKPWENEELIEVVSEAARTYLEESGLAGTDKGILF